MTKAVFDCRGIGFLSLCLSAALAPWGVGCQTPAPAENGEDTNVGRDHAGGASSNDAKGGSAKTSVGGSTNRGGADGSTNRGGAAGTSNRGGAAGGGSNRGGGAGTSNRGGAGNANRGGAGNATTAAGGSAGAGTTECTPAASGARPHEIGNYDNRSCNATDCHNDMIGGGWVYASAKGVPWIEGATITLTNTDGTKVTAVSAKDGFFNITGTVLPHYTACVSKCPGTDCSKTDHPNADCQTSNCHGQPTQRVYVSQQPVANGGGSSGAGGSNSKDAGGGDCTPPASGGPYTHREAFYGRQACASGGCHLDPKPVYMGGYLYDDLTSSKTVAEATITLTQGNDPPVTAVTGPDGMFFFGTVGATSTPTTFKAPYTACVSKCPLTICSKKDGHTTTGDCQTSDCHHSEYKVYLK